MHEGDGAQPEIQHAKSLPGYSELPAAAAAGPEG